MPACSDDPFLAHLIRVLSIYERGPPVSIPRYDGPSTPQTDHILRALNTIANRVFTLPLENSPDARNVPSNPSSSLSSPPQSLPYNAATCLETSSSSSIPLLVHPCPLSNIAFESDTSAVDQLLLMKAQVNDVVRVCDAVARGDLSHKISVPVHGAYMVQLKDVVNGMVDRLNKFAKEVTRVSHEFGTEGILGGHACMEGVQGTWADLTSNVNKMASNITNQMRSISEVTKAVALGDLSKRVQLDAQGEMLDVKMTVNLMVDQLSTLANEVTRLSLKVGTEGILGGQANVPDLQGIWKVLTDNVNLMALNLTNLVRSIADVAKAVTSGDLTKAIQVDVPGEFLDLKETVNEMTESLSDFTNEVTRVVREVGTEGLLGRQAKVTNVSGAWKDLTDHVNSMATNLTLQVRTFAVAMTAVARGDLTQNVTGLPVSGEYLHLVNTINDMIDGLGFFASEVKKVTCQVGTHWQGSLGVQAQVGNAQGIWQELTMSVNTMANNLTDQIQAFAQISSAPMDNDYFTRSITVESGGELNSLKTLVNRMLSNLRDNIKNAVAKEAAELIKHGKYEFLGHVALEMIAPMNGIAGMAEISLESELSRSQRENWLLVHSLSRHILLVIDELSDISKIETGRMVMAQVSFSFRQTVFGILKTLVVRTASNNVDLTYDVDPSIPDQHIGDPRRLQHVITNLVTVSNAIKSTPNRGCISLSCRRLALDDSTVTLEVCVSGNGFGIDKDKLNLISRAISQADCWTIGEYEGVGLGLSISKGLVSLMGGSMWVESVAGKGSKFVFAITPQIGQLSMDTTLVKMMPFGNRNILFVDTQYDRTAVDRIQELGLGLRVIHDPLEVADKTTCRHIDIIFVDSLSVTETVREHEHLRQIPIVLLAPDLTRLDMKWCYDNDIYFAVTTPVSTQDLASVLISAFESSTVCPLAAANDMKFDILCAEDNFVGQRLVVKILEKYGHTVEIADNGLLAVDAFKVRVEQNRPFDIIIMKVSLPIMGGIEATGLIRAYEKHNSLTPTPIIALTVQAASDDREQCFDAGMDDLITKPIRRSDLLNSIVKLTGERARQRGHPIPVDVDAL